MACAPIWPWPRGGSSRTYISALDCEATRERVIPFFNNATPQLPSLGCSACWVGTACTCSAIAKPTAAAATISPSLLCARYTLQGILPAALPPHRTHVNSLHAATALRYNLAGILPICTEPHTTCTCTRTTRLRNITCGPHHAHATTAAAACSAQPRTKRHVNCQKPSSGHPAAQPRLAIGQVRAGRFSTAPAQHSTALRSTAACTAALE